MKNILIVRQHNQIGDMLCSLSLYKAIKKKYPDSHITLVAAKTNYQIPFFDINPYVNRVLIYDKSSYKTMLNFYSQLRDRKYNFGFVPSTVKVSRTSHIINFLSGAKIRIGVNSIDGEINKSSYLLNIKDDFRWKGKHQLLRNLEIAQIAGFDLTEEELKEIKLTSSDDEIYFVKNFIEENFPDRAKSIIAFHPGAGKTVNIYPTENFIQLIKKLYKKFNNYVLLTSGWTDDTILKRVTSALEQDGIYYKVVNNLPVKKLGAILSMINLYITNDTGTMHIAGFSGTKMISLFGPTDPNEWAPLSKNSFYLKSETGRIENIDVEDIFTLAQKILNTN